MNICKTQLGLGSRPILGLTFGPRTLSIGRLTLGTITELDLQRAPEFLCCVATSLAIELLSRRLFQKKTGVCKRKTQ